MTDYHHHWQSLRLSKSRVMCLESRFLKRSCCHGNWDFTGSLTMSSKTQGQRLIWKMEKLTVVTIHGSTATTQEGYISCWGNQILRHSNNHSIRIAAQGKGVGLNNKNICIFCAIPLVDKLHFHQAPSLNSNSSWLPDHLSLRQLIGQKVQQLASFLIFKNFLSSSIYSADAHRSPGFILNGPFEIESENWDYGQHQRKSRPWQCITQAAACNNWKHTATFMNQNSKVYF